MINHSDAITGCLIGGAIGDALGLPYEGLTASRARRLLGLPDRFRFIFGQGFVSDDTEHACLVAQALVASGDHLDRFTSELASRLRVWLLSCPAGIGLATLRATLKLCVGVSPDRSGVDSAGNGPAMRSAILGASIDDIPLLREFVRRSARITHTDPRAEQGAFAVALAAHLAARQRPIDPSEFVLQLRSHLDQPSAGEFLNLLEQMRTSLARGQMTAEFAASLGRDRYVTGYILQTVPVALHAWLSSPTDYRTAVTNVILCGGDTDTTAAIVGGIIGAGVGTEGIPDEWRSRLLEWPRTLGWMQNLAGQLSQVRETHQAERPIRSSFASQLVRNAFFLSVVFSHVVRRWLPPIRFGSAIAQPNQRPSTVQTTPPTR